jgi:D-glycerate 3-kinase
MYSFPGFNPAEIAAGEPLTAALRSQLVQSVEKDSIPCSVWGGLSAEHQADERAATLAGTGGVFARWWRTRVPHAEIPWGSLWRVYIPLAQWILRRKRSLPGKLFVFGVNGTIGQGKSVLAESLVVLLNQLLRPEEGRALTRSLDDYYLPKVLREKPEFRALGYDPGPGVSNRGPAGTHDVRRLCGDMNILERASEGTITELPRFDKQADDRAAEPYPFFGRAAVFILDGWFVGCETSVDWRNLSAGLKRSAGKALPEYAPAFDRLDGLWAFEPPPIKQILVDRLNQQAYLDRSSGRSGMSPDSIKRFVRYFYEDSWQPGLTSCFPAEERVSFWAKVDSSHEFISVRNGGRAQPA